jgi:multidrug efflux pump subunit AcrA (membrane-fusion protein)
MTKGPELRMSQSLAISMVALGLCAGCSSQVEKPAPPPPGVTVATVVQQDVPVQQEWVGTMVGNVDADIRPKVEGFLLTRLYTEGSFVNKGQAMSQLDKRQAAAAVEQATGNLERARAALSQAQIDVRRYTPLVAQRAVSQAELDKANLAATNSIATSYDFARPLKTTSSGPASSSLSIGWKSAKKNSSVVSKRASRIPCVNGS